MKIFDDGVVCRVGLQCLESADVDVEVNVENGADSVLPEGMRERLSCFLDLVLKRQNRTKRISRCLNMLASPHTSVCMGPRSDSRGRGCGNPSTSWLKLATGRMRDHETCKDGISCAPETLRANEREALGGKTEDRECF